MNGSITKQLIKEEPRRFSYVLRMQAEKLKQVEINKIPDNEERLSYKLRKQAEKLKKVVSVK